MPAEQFFNLGSEVYGVSAFKKLEGKVVNNKESGFGFQFAEVERADGTKQWARTMYLRLSRVARPEKKKNRKK